MHLYPRRGLGSGQRAEMTVAGPGDLDACRRRVAGGTGVVRAPDMIWKETFFTIPGKLGNHARSGSPHRSL